MLIKAKKITLQRFLLLGFMSFAIFLFLAFIFIPRFFPSLTKPDYAQLAADINSAALDIYNQHKFRVLIVPGHDDNPASGGTQFQGLKEADLNLQVGQALFKILSADSHFETFITRNVSGYLEPFASYLKDQDGSIRTFRDQAIQRTNAEIASGVNFSDPIDHNYASDENSIKLYGINKWVDENNINLVLHIHFNDYGGRRLNQTGKYSGFTIYTAAKEMPNYVASSELSKSFFNTLKQFLAVNNEPLEAKGIIEDPWLIAMGEDKTLKETVASTLIEYGYIYEAAWANPATRPMMIKELAYQTYVGLKKYFGNEADKFWPDKQPSPGNYVWRDEFGAGVRHNPSVLALQLALAQAGSYPPAGSDLHDCPVSGSFGTCTRSAVVGFQILNSLPATGYVGPLTLKKINDLCGRTLPQLVSSP